MTPLLPLTNTDRASEVPLHQQRISPYKVLSQPSYLPSDTAQVAQVWKDGKLHPWKDKDSLLDFIFYTWLLGIGEDGPQTQAALDMINDPKFNVSDINEPSA